MVTQHGDSASVGGYDGIGAVQTEGGYVHCWGGVVLYSCVHVSRVLVIIVSFSCITLFKLMGSSLRTYVVGVVEYGDKSGTTHFSHRY